jgi:hypothetical protein
MCLALKQFRVEIVYFCGRMAVFHMMKLRVFCWIVLVSLAEGHVVFAGGAEVDRFVGKYCTECHDADMKKGGLDLTALKWDLQDANAFGKWTTVLDRVMNGEMPPAKKPRPAAGDLKGFTNFVGGALLEADRAQVAAEGRAVNRRLNRFEYEESLRDLLGLPYLEVRNFLPEDRESHLFNKVGDALDVSHVQLARYLTASEFALRQAMAPQVDKPEVKTVKVYTMEERAFFGKINLGPPVRSTHPLVGLELLTNLVAQANPQMPHTTDPERREKEAMAVVVSTYEPTEIRFSTFRAPVTGRYKLKFSAYSINMAANYKSVSRAKRSEPVTIYAEKPPQALRKLGWFDVGPDPTVCEIEAWLLAGETIRPDASRLHRSRPPDHKNPDQTPDGMPGVAFQWMEASGPFFDEWPTKSHRLLFGDLPMEQEEVKAEPQGEGRRFRQPLKTFKVTVTSKEPEKDAERLLRNFLQKAYRRPVEEEDVQRFLGVIRSARNKGANFTESMLAGYTAVLSSPGFLYFQEKPGRLEDLALAERLSYFLWNTAPDAELRTLALKKELHRPKVLRAQTERLLIDPKARQFVNAFLDYWLELRAIAGAAPDEELYPDYQLDDHLAESMIEETQLFFAELLKQNLNVTNLVNSDFAMLNERLAKHYGIPDVNGVNVRRVALPKESVRGGLLTEASILKVTANGTTTSPVKRGAWIMTRIIGRPPSPPPEAVSAVEPDIRGATTIREQLAKHRNQESCNVCHRNIDPAGFALESFDVMGGWRDRYRSVGGPEKVKGIGHNGNYFHFSLGPKVDSSGELPDGRKFDDVRQLKICLASDPDQLARNLAKQLTVYATGAAIRFSDRPALAKILAENRKANYGMRELIHEIVQSDLFLNK